MFYWFYVHTSDTQSDLDNTESFEEISLTDACAPHCPENIVDTGRVPGDRRGAGGLDSSLFL